MNALQIDAMKELANIGTGNAATALSELIGKRVELSVPRVDIIPLEEVSTLFGDPETPVCAVLAECESSLEAVMVLVMPLEDAEELSEILLSSISLHIQEEKRAEIKESSLAEAGNIILGAFISALGDMLNIRLPLSVPSIAFDMLGSIMDVVVGIFGISGDTAFLVETPLTFPEDENSNFSARMILIPSPDSLQRFMTALGVK